MLCNQFLTVIFGNYLQQDHEVQQGQQGQQGHQVPGT